MNESSVGEVPNDDGTGVDSRGQRYELDRTDPSNPSGPRAVRANMTLWEATALFVWTALADYLIYRTYGYSGPAVFFAAAPIFFLIPRSIDGARRSSSPTHWVAKTFCIVLLVCTSLRLAMIGNGFVVLCGVLLVFALALASSNVFPWALETMAMSFRSLIDGIIWFARHRLPAVGGDAGSERSGTRAVTWFLPMLATVVFGSIFVFANPELLESVSLRLTAVSDWARQWASRLDALEAVFCTAAILIGAGLFFPYFGKAQIGGNDQSSEAIEPFDSPLYSAFRNTLLCLIVLFGVYLVFEFATLWKREFPPGFYFAGYAHQGAAWLTAALALATGLLSLIFRGHTLHDARIDKLKVLAWVWSAANFLLAIAVYNRLMIYVGYNGLTVMRIVGFFGITVVVVGFCLVLSKIRLQKGFWWLLRTQLTALLLCVLAFILFPVDYVAHRYNAFRINQGYHHPAVMIAVKPKDDSGYLPIVDLVNVTDPIIREGVRAMLAERQRMIRSQTDATPWHWTRFQGATQLLYSRMIENEALWEQYLDDDEKRGDAINRFTDYAMQWY